jgi:threonyl-tRNA synthetase
MWYHATKKTQMAEPVTVKEDCMEECVVLFCCVEKLDEKNPEHVVESATREVISRLGKLGVSRVLIYPYAHLTSTLGSAAVSLTILKNLENSLKEKDIVVKRAPFGWYKQFEIRGKGHPLADLSMTICPYEGTECDFTCPYCHHPFKEADAEQVCPGPHACSSAPQTKTGGPPFNRQNG